MSVLFYISAVVAVVSALLVITRRVAMHALVNLVVTFLALACIFWTLGAPFAAVLQIVVYAGAILVLFVFAVMILHPLTQQDLGTPSRLGWIVPSILSAILFAEFIAAVSNTKSGVIGAIGAVQVGESLFTVYALGVEIASVMLLSALVAALHFGAKHTSAEAQNE